MSIRAALPPLASSGVASGALQLRRAPDHRRAGLCRRSPRGALRGVGRRLYNPGHYEPKDQAREAWLQRPDDPTPCSSQIPWNTIVNVGLFLVVAAGVDRRSIAQPGPTPPAAPLSEPRTYRLVLSYDGTAFHGWQVQPDAPTVQGTLLAAAGRLFPGGVRVVGASRTDAGVHATRARPSR